MTLQFGRTYTITRYLAQPGSANLKAFNYRPLPTSASSPDTSSSDLEVKLAVLESTREPFFEFSFEKAGELLFKIGPADLAERLVRSSSSVYCPAVDALS